MKKIVLLFSVVISMVIISCGTTGNDQTEAAGNEANASAQAEEQRVTNEIVAAEEETNNEVEETKE